MNEIAAILDVPCLADATPGGIDCHSWCPLELESGAELDYCAVCGAAEAEHPADSFPDEFGNSGCA